MRQAHFRHQHSLAESKRTLPCTLHSIPTHLCFNQPTHEPSHYYPCVRYIVQQNASPSISVDRRQMFWMVMRTTPPTVYAINALTPPPSDSKDLLPVNTTLALLWELYHGLNIICGPWHFIRLPVGGYEELVRNVNASSSLEAFVNNKARYRFLWLLKLRLY